MGQPKGMPGTEHGPNPKRRFGGLWHVRDGTPVTYCGNALFANERGFHEIYPRR